VTYRFPEACLDMHGAFVCLVIVAPVFRASAFGVRRKLQSGRVVFYSMCRGLHHKRYIKPPAAQSECETHGHCTLSLVHPTEVDVRNVSGGVLRSNAHTLIVWMGVIPSSALARCTCFLDLSNVTELCCDCECQTLEAKLCFRSPSPSVAYRGLDF